MATHVAMLKPTSPEGRAAQGGARVRPAASPAATRHTAATADAHPDDAGTPFYDHLMSMIDATALENRRAEQDHETDAAPLLPDYSWRAGQLIAGTAGLIAVAAVGAAMIGSGVGLRERPPVIAADSAPDKSVSPVVASATKADDAAERTLVTSEIDGRKPTGVDVKGTDEGSIETGSVAVAKPGEPPVAKPAAEPPREKLGSGPATETDGPAEGATSAKAAPTDMPPPTEDPPSEKEEVGAPLSPAPESKAQSTPKGPDAVRIARIVSDVKMRAGPSNGQAVLATIPRGTTVEVIECRGWCEIIFRGQRGWIYKSFMGATEISRGG
jgi:SH3 domain-containing protein